MTMTDTKTGVVYSDTGTGAFTADDGEQLLPGWQVNVGFDNFVRAVTDASIRGPLISVTVWTFVFAIVSVASTFFLGLLMALVFNNTRMRFRNTYRIIMILPYAFPAFLSALVWAGMMNESFGFINQVLLGGAEIPWLTDPTLAKVSVLIVNLWLGFPYMFLVCMGALQGIPSDVNEAASMDGASAWRRFTAVTWPSLRPIVTSITSLNFIWNFNSFSLVYVLTEGGPGGRTMLPMLFTYLEAFKNRNIGYAAAMGVVLVIVVVLLLAIYLRSQFRSEKES